MQALTGGMGAPFALDAVGGETGSAAARSLAPGGRLLVFGTLAEEPLSLPSRMLFLGTKRIEGFWLSEWAGRQSIVSMMRLFRRIQDLMAKGVLTTETGPSFPLDDVQGAVRQALAPGRSGKILLRMGA